jgi:hypothetical protein
MNVMEYLVPILTTKKKLEDKIIEYKDALNLYLPTEKHFKDKNILGMDKVQTELSSAAREDLSIRQF